MAPVPDFTHYARHFSEPGFFAVVRGTARKVPFLRAAVTLYYCWKDATTPVWVKGLIVGALGYFVFPFDAVPDVLPIVGWLDDAGVIMAALATIRAYVKPEHRNAADQFLGGERAQPASS